MSVIHYEGGVLAGFSMGAVHMAAALTGCRKALAGPFLSVLTQT